MTVLPIGPAEQEDILGGLEIPRLRITAMVAEGSDVKTLGRAVGHICCPFEFVGHAPMRFVVHARQVEVVAGD